MKKQNKVPDCPSQKPWDLKFTTLVGVCCRDNFFMPLGLSLPTKTFLYTNLMKKSFNLLALPCLLRRQGYIVFRFIIEYSSLRDFGRPSVIIIIIIIGLFFIIWGFLKDDHFGLCWNLRLFLNCWYSKKQKLGLSNNPIEFLSMLNQLKHFVPKLEC